MEVEGELRYREYAPAESHRSVRTAEIYATSILALDRSAEKPILTEGHAPVWMSCDLEAKPAVPAAVAERTGSQSSNR